MQGHCPSRGVFSYHWISSSSSRDGVNGLSWASCGQKHLLLAHSPPAQLVQVIVKLTDCMVHYEYCATPQVLVLPSSFSCVPGPAGG